MSKKVHFSVQCRMVNGRRILVSWIPEPYAIKGKVLRLFDRNKKEWEDNWVVMDVGSKQPYEFIRERSQDYKRMKDITDISKEERKFNVKSLS